MFFFGFTKNVPKLQNQIGLHRNILCATKRRNIINGDILIRTLKMSGLIPPPEVRGMKKLDKEKFIIVSKVPAVKIKESHLKDVMRYLKKYLLKMVNLKPVQSKDSDIQNLSDVTSEVIDTPNTIETSIKYAYLNPYQIKEWSDIEDKDRDGLAKCTVTEDNFLIADVKLTYDNWNHDEILKAILPENDQLTSYSKVGHIVHVNLRDHHLDYKTIIGQVLLDKIKQCKTVVNKTNNIDNTYRNFSMEVLCGEENFLALVKENKWSFEFDFSQVYWNSRLSTEHERITNLLKNGDILFDVFAGVGPFSIPAAKKNCIVFANDLNPQSFKWLNHNAKLNKVKECNFKSYNLDGRQFIKEVFAQYYVKEFVECNSELNADCDIHLTMNLPALAVEFLDTFRGLLKNKTLKNKDTFKNPIVHVYCFVQGDTPNETAKEVVENNLGYPLENDIIEVFKVRNVSPKKEMMRISFRLSHDKLFENSGYKSEESIVGEKRKSFCNDDNEPEYKHTRL